MFRGGRVDARGTGITSNLGYNNGGRVGYKDKGFVGGQLLSDPGAAVGLDIFSKEYKPKDYRQKKAEYEKYEPEITSLADIEKLYNKKLTDDEAYLSSLDIEGPLTPDPDRWDDWYDLAGKDGRTEFFQKKRDEEKKKIDEAAKFGVTINTELEDALAGEKLQEELELTPAQLENIELRKLLEEQMKPGTAEEEIEKNKKIFQKAYGSGVADDASAMLMGLAGKMLKPEATVKSGFGEFFEAEGKRPSERKKYKDAATTAAINAYLTGQTSFKKFEDQLALTKAGVDYQLLAKRPKNLNEAFTYFLKTGDDATDPGIMSQSVEAIYGLGSFAGKLLEDPKKLIVGKVYYADDPNNKINKVLFLIDENQEPQPIKTVYK